MKIHSNTRRTLFDQFNNGNTYGITKMPTNSISNMIDIGANIGMISLLAKILHPQMNVFAFEPHPKTFESLQSNVKGMKISTHNYAFGNGDTFYLTAQRKMDLCNKFSVKEDIERKKDGLEMPSFSLPEIYNMIKIEPEETFLKMDCEGAEFFLMGDKKSEDILRRTKFISMEVHGSKHVHTNDFVYWFLNTLSGSHILIMERCNITLAQLTAVEKVYYRDEFDR